MSVTVICRLALWSDASCGCWPSDIWTSLHCEMCCSKTTYERVWSHDTSSPPHVTIVAHLAAAEYAAWLVLCRLSQGHCQWTQCQNSSQVLLLKRQLQANHCFYSESMSGVLAGLSGTPCCTCQASGLRRTAVVLLRGYTFCYNVWSVRDWKKRDTKWRRTARKVQREARVL